MVDLRADLFEVSSDNFDDVLGRFFGRFGILGHVIAVMVFQEFSHQGVDGAPGEDIRAPFVIVQAAEEAFQLADDFPDAIDEIRLFS